MSTADSGVSVVRAIRRDAIGTSTPSSVSRAPRREAEDLIAARVGEDRPRPRHERVQAAARARSRLVAGPQVQVIGVREDDLGAERLELVDA